MNTLPIVLEDHGKHLYEQIYEYIRNEIREGKLVEGEKLPSTRFLAQHLQISRSTVDLAYDQLVAEGYIVSVPYKGYFVQAAEDIVQIQTKPSKQVRSMPVKTQKYKVDFDPNGMDQNAFPYDTWRKINKYVLAEEDIHMFVSGPHKGEIELRETLCQYLYASRGVQCNPENIIVGAGNDYLLMLLEKILGRECTVAFETPSYQRAHKIFYNSHCTVVNIPMDEQGIRVEKLREENVDLVYVMPSHQFPTGIVMPIGRRMELLKWATEAQGRYIIEDDYDSEFRYKGKPIPALKAADKEGRVIYIGTFSKSIAPSIRISFMVLPDTLLPRYEEKASFYSSTVSRIEQEVLREFIAGGYFERHLNRMRKIYKEKHDVMLNECKVFRKEFDLFGDYAGLHIVLKSKENRNEKELVEKAKAMGVRVYGMGGYQSPPSKDLEQTEQKASILLGYGGLSQKEIKEGILNIKNAWEI